MNAYRKELDTASLEAKARQSYCGMAALALENDTLKNEIARLINKSADKIIRKTTCDNEVAYERGIIHGLEALEERLKTLANERKQYK